MNNRQQILIAGVGNIFFGDDAFGSEVARQLAPRVNSQYVRVVDFGIRALDLAYALVDGYKATVIVDTTSRGGEPGTLYIIEPDFTELGNVAATVEAHGMDPLRVLALARSLGADLKNIRIIGCEPATLDPGNDGRLGLSPHVAAAVETAIGAIESLIAERAAELSATD